jgi:hypothetical protein
MQCKLLVLILVEALIVSTAIVSATDLRGRIDGPYPYTGVWGPRPGVPVALFAASPNGYLLVRQAVTGPDGMYYFRGVYPGPYFLQVQGANYQLVVGLTSLQDIPVTYVR